MPILDSVVPSTAVELTATPLVLTLDPASGVKAQNVSGVYFRSSSYAATDVVGDEDTQTVTCTTPLVPAGTYNILLWDGLATWNTHTDFVFTKIPVRIDRDAPGDFSSGDSSSPSADGTSGGQMSALRSTTAASLGSAPGGMTSPSVPGRVDGTQ